MASTINKFSAIAVMCSVSAVYAQESIHSKSIRSSTIQQYQIATTSTQSKKVFGDVEQQVLDKAIQLSNDGKSLNKSVRQQIEKKMYGGTGKELEIIYDSGNTVSIDNYYLPNPQIKPKDVVESQLHNARKTAIKGINNADQKHIEQIQKGHFPVKPSVIKFSTAGKKQILRDIPELQYSMFIVGDDEYSLKWMEKNKGELLRFGAVGVLTDVGSMARYKQILKQMSPLSLMPVPADFMTDKFDIKSYPVLVTKQGEFR